MAEHARGADGQSCYTPEWNPQQVGRLLCSTAEARIRGRIPVLSSQTREFDILQVARGEVRRTLRRYCLSRRGRKTR